MIETMMKWLWGLGMSMLVSACDELLVAPDEAAGDDLAEEIGLVEGAAYTYLGPIATTLAGGQSRVYAVTVTAGETLVAHAVPDGLGGDVDLYLYDADPSAPFVVPKKLASSTRGAGYVDGVYWSLPMGPTVTRYVKLVCFSGPCAFKSWVTVGDATTLRIGDVYLNQRSFVGQSGKCKSSTGATLADGECYCAPASAAMRVVLDGKRRVTALRDVATDLFGTNTSGGAANRVAIMQRLRDVYSYSSCSETSYSASMLATLKSALREGSLVLFRSNRLTSAGHYVSVIGYSVTDGRHRLTVDDPYGRWSSTNVYSTNTISETSAIGRGQSYDYLDITNATSSIIVCR